MHALQVERAADMPLESETPRGREIRVTRGVVPERDLEWRGG
jgi:hypothetical protein